MSLSYPASRRSRVATNVTRGPKAPDAGGVDNPADILDAGGTLVCWIRPDLGKTEATGISELLDQSSSGNDLSQSTGSKQPAYEATGGLNSQPCITFDAATAEQLDGLEDLTTGNTDRWEILIVAQTTDTSGNHMVLNLRNDSNPFTVLKLSLPDGSTPNFEAEILPASGPKDKIEHTVDTDWHLFRVSWNSTAHSFSMDGSETTGANSSGIDGSTLTQIILGASNDSGGDAFDGKVCDLIMIDTTPSSGEQTDLIAYLNDRYDQSWTW